MSEAISYCAGQVRALDPDRWLLALMLPPAIREDALTLYAFNLEIARTRDLVSDSVTGQIRLQWWRDRVAEARDGTIARHQVLTPLVAAIARHGWEAGDLEAMLTAREFDLTDDPPARLEDLRHYCRDTAAVPLQMLLEALGVRDEAARAAAWHVGIAYALVGLVRAMPQHCHARRVYVPDEVLGEAGLSALDLIEGRNKPARRQAAAILIGHARTHLEEARHYHRVMPAPARRVLLAAVLAEQRARRLQVVDHDPFSPAAEKPMPLLPLRLSLAAARGHY